MRLAIVFGALLVVAAVWMWLDGSWVMTEEEYRRRIKARAMKRAKADLHHTYRKGER